MKKVALMAALLVCVAALAQKKSDPWAGTWKFDASKSKAPNPAMTPKDETVVLEPQAPGSNVIKWSAKGTEADGSAFTESFDGKSDGKPYPFIRNGKEEGKASYQKTGSHQYKSTGTFNDGTTSTGTITLSNDGKTITVNQHIKSTQGEADVTEVFNRS
jgi:hypothetical protein